MKKIFIWSALALAVLAPFVRCLADAASSNAVAAVAYQTDGEAWNAGVDFYRAGDMTNALRVLRPLTLTRSHGARAAEVVAAIEYERGDLESAAAAAQIALRAAPEDAKANRNFTRATDRLPQERKTRHIEEVLRAAQGQDPGSMLLRATYEARDLMEKSAAVATNPPLKAVKLSDALSKRARTLADVWIPVRQVIAQSVTNEEQAATIMAQIENAETRSKAAVRYLEDMDENAYGTLSYAEHDLTRFLKMTVLPPAAIAEDEQAQTNAWMDVADFNGRSWQQDALDFTRAFRAKFPAWARAYEQQAQSDTNRPPFTAEDQAKVSALATELEKLQLECVEKDLPPQQEAALNVIAQIRELLPKDPNGGGQSQPNQSQSKRDAQPQDQPQNQQDQQDQSDSQNQDRQTQDPNDSDNQSDQDREAEAQESQDDREDEADDAVLKKAQERSDEHEAEKKARMRKMQLPPNSRDW